MPAPGYLLDDRRVGDLAARVAREVASPDLRVGRAVLFLTPLCNMACGYCRSTRHPMPPWPEEAVLGLLDELADTRTRHVHWTGGEPTLHPGLLALVRHSARRGLDNSLSTNGGADPELYVALSREGVSRFFFSFDALDPHRFDEITRSQGRLPHVLRTFRTVCGLRDRGQRVHVTLNTVLTRELVRDLMEEDGAGLQQFLAWLSRCGADDFKFLPTSTEPWAEIFPDPQRLARWFEICCRAVPDRFRMFHYRLGTLSSGGHGFRDLRRRQCFQCLDDRAYDSRGVYSCVVRLREGCAPLYAHADPTDVKQRKLKAFLSGDRSRDRTCRRLCFDLYRDLNQRVGQVLGIEPAGKG